MAIGEVILGYLEDPYLEGGYLLGDVNSGLPVQLDVFQTGIMSVELFAFSETQGAAGIQLIVSETLGYTQCEGEGYLEQPYLENAYLANHLCVGLGIELDVIIRRGLGIELLVRNYNDKLCRVMCDIESRGDSLTNWTASSTLTSATDSFNINNVDNDLEERVWRSNNVLTGIILDNDAGAGNTVTVDTIFMRAHNFTTSASINLLLSDDPTFTVIGQTIPISITDSEEFYYIAEDAPLSGYRYSRTTIEDPTNSNSYLQIGVYGYGQSEVFEDKCFVLPIESEDTEYADVIRTEAYTNKMNFRARRRKLRMNFKNFVYDSQDWKRLQRIIDCAGITQKALWIPTPQQPYRYASWAKLTKLPRYRNNDIGSGNQSYIDFSLETDEVL
ncbi:MAG TPA: hypothetical protein VMW45_03150 [Dehalococcoidia bacterium]|nr:hypothetical protein [Dehalococcoidia bacterium]